MSFKIVRNDITKMNTDAIVNTANEQVCVGDGCDVAIYNAAGYAELLKYRQENVGPRPEGDAFITPGFNLKAKYIIHAVSPVYITGDLDEEEKLRSCYRKSLALAKEYGLKSISFPLISTGSYGYPKEEGMRIAVDEINEFLLENDMLIYLVVFDTQSTLLGEKFYPGLNAYIDYHYVSEKRQEEYGNRHFGTIPPEDPEYPSYRVKREELDKRTQSAQPDFRKESLDFSSKAAPHDSNVIFPRQENVCDSSPVIEDESEAICENIADVDEISFRKGKCSITNKADSLFDLDDEDSTELLNKKLKERMAHMTDTFSEYLLYLIKQKGMENSEVHKRAIVDKKLFSKIKNNPDYHPQKITCLCLCVGAKLNLDETKDLLARAGYALSPCDMTDIIFQFFIENGHYDVIDIDIQLEEYGLPCIIR